MAPELVEGVVGEEADVFAIGITILQVSNS